MRKRRKYQEGGESRYVQPKNILNPKAPKQYPVYKQPRDPNAFYRNASPGSINEDYTIESFLLPSPALKGAGQLYKGTKAGLKRLAKEGLEDEAKLASEYATKVQSRANIAAKRDGRLLNKQRVLGQADFEDLTNDARHFYSEHGIELPPAEFDAIKHLNPHVNKAAARQALKAADAGDDVFGGLHGKATLRDARRAGLSDDEINQMRAGRLKPYTNPAKPIVGFYGANRHGGKVSYGDGGRLIPNPGFDTGMQRSDATRTRIPQSVKAAVASEEYNRDLTGRSGLSEEGFRTKYNKSRRQARNMPSSSEVIANQVWEGAKVPFKLIGADPDLIRKNPVEGISQALAGTLMAELPVNEMYQATKQGISGLKKALGTESGLLSRTYKVNPWAFKPNPEAYYHRSPNLENIINKETGMLQGFGASEEGKLLNETTGLGLGKGISIKKAPHSEIYYSKGTPLDGGRTNMVLDEKTGRLIPGQFYKGPYMVEVTDVPFVAKANGKFSKVFNPETGQYVRGELPPSGKGNYAVAKRPISLDEAKFYKEDWLRGYKEVPKPASTFKSEIDWRNWVKYKEDFDNNPQVIKHLNDIEQTTKANGTWMKNPDGSLFQGTPEQFVIQQSDNFKKAFPNVLRDKAGNVQINYHGSPENISEFLPNSNMGELGIGTYTTINKGYAKGFANTRKGTNPTILELYQNTNNPQPFYKEYEEFANDKIKQFNKKTRFLPKFTDKYKFLSNQLDKDLSGRHSDLYTAGKFYLQEPFDLFTKGHQTVVPFTNYPKSAIGNILLDMTNPNIYKAVVPTIMGATALKTRQQKREGGEIEPYNISDPVEFKRANQAYQDSLSLYKLGEAELRRFYKGVPGESYGRIRNLRDLNKATQTYSGVTPKNQLYNKERDLLPSKGNTQKISNIYNRTGILPTKFWANEGFLNYRFKKPVRKPIYTPIEEPTRDTVLVPSNEPRVSATSPNDTILELGRSTVGKDGKRLYRKGTQDISEQEFNQLLQTYPKSRVKEYGFGGKLFKSIGDGLQNSGAFLADNALSIVGATEAANNLYTDSRFGKAAQNVSKVTNQINKVAGTIGATALGGPAAGMAMSQVQNMTGNINRKPNQEYNDWDVAGQYAGSLSSMAGMFYNPAGATSSVNPKAKYGGSIRRKIAKQGGTIRPTKGGMFINEGFGVEHALGNLHEDGGIVYNDRTEVENNEKILDGNYVLTDQPYSEPYMKESISRRFDKNSKAISDRNNPDITESAMSFLKDEAIAKNEEYLESLDNMTGKYKKGGLINRRRALDFMYRKMHKQGGVLSNLGTQEGRVVTNRGMYAPGGTITDKLNQEEALKMAQLKQSLLQNPTNPVSQKQYFIDPANYAYDPTWMGDIYNTARNHDIAVQRTNDISNDPNYAGYGQGSKGIPYKYPSPKPQKQFPWEDTLYGVASLAPAIYNMGAGLFGKTQQYNPENYITRGRLNYKPISGEETKRQINSQRAATDYQLRDAGITSRRSRLNNSYNAMQTMAQAQERIDNINTQGQLETDRFNLGLDQGNNRIRLTVADINDRNKAARQQMLAQGLSDVSEFAQGTKRDKIMKSMLTKMYGRRGGRIAW